MVYSWIIASCAAFTAASYLILVDQSHFLPVCISLALFALANLIRARSPALQAGRVGALMLFQWFVNDWWCLLLYLLVLGKDYDRYKSLNSARFFTACYAAAFLAVAAPELWRHPPPLRWSAIGLALLFFAFGAGVIEYVISRMKQADSLYKEKSMLVSCDPLTGLLNFNEAHRRLEKLINEGEPLLLVLIDCADLKAMNVTKGYRTGNLILKQIAELLTISFPDAKLIARYGGDEFALALPLGGEPRTTDHARQLLDSELPKLTGIRMTYALAYYPADAVSKDALLLEAENRLYTKKREIWLEKEEHLLRSEKLRVVGELASGMAHEIRNPLTAVKGFLQISRSNGYNIEPWYGLIMDEINRMSDLTAEFLQFSKPSSTDYRKQTLQSCIQRVIALTETEASRLGHRLLYEHPDEPIVLWMDPDKIVQLLLNLVKNAFEAMPDGGTLFIRLHLSGDRATVEVQDTGVGIPTERLETIFHPFYTTKEYGTGLGLSISHKIVQDHGGTLEVESIVGEGTKFVLTFPLPASTAGAG
jgi:diguanylate cyclase (GGDEF)-like protein